jgi:hypothetical protein
MNTEAPPDRRSFRDLTTTRKITMILVSVAALLFLAIIAGVLLAPDYTRIETPAGATPLSTANHPDPASPPGPGCWSTR